MSEEIRHRFNRLTFYTLLLAFLTISMTFVVFSSVAQVSLSCAAGQFVNFIGTTSDSCGPAMVSCGSAATQIQCGNWTCTTPIGSIKCTQIRSFSPAFTKAPKVYVNLNPGSAILGSAFSYSNVQFMAPTSTGQTTTIPAAAQEIFNDAQGQHELYLDSSLLSQVRFSIVCTASITSASPVVLSSQFSYDNGATWHFTVDTGLADLHLDGLNVANGGVGDCGGAGSSDVMEPPGGFTDHYSSVSHNINASTPNLTNLLYRFITFGGGISGTDTATFTELKMELKTTGLINPNNDVLSFFFAGNALAITAAQFTVQGNIVGFCGCANSQKVISGNWTAIAS